MTELAAKVEEGLDEDGNPIVAPDPDELDPDALIAPEPELDDDGNQIEDEVPAFMLEDDDDDDPSKTMPVAAHIKKKRKLQGKLDDADGEIERLTNENAKLKAGTVQHVVDETLVRPKRDDFDEEDDYDEALEVYRDKKDDARHAARTTNDKSKTKARDVQQTRETAVSEHYDRAEKLVKEFNITPEAYTKADKEVRKAVESIMPKRGNGIIDHLITEMGEGSEKVIYYLGVNKTARLELQTALLEDSFGIKAAVYLGKLSSKMDGTKTKTSRAAKPAKKVDGGDGGIPAGAKAALKKYKGAKNPQESFNIKRQAKKDGIDTSTW